MRRKQNRKVDPLSLKDLAAVLTSWSQATTHFYSLYKALEASINTCKQQTHNPAQLVRQCSLMELQEARQEMVHELAVLINDLKKKPSSEPEPTLTELKLLYAQTLRLNKLIKRMQRILGLNSLTAS